MVLALGGSGSLTFVASGSLRPAGPRPPGSSGAQPFCSFSQQKVFLSADHPFSQSSSKPSSQSNSQPFSSVVQQTIFFLSDHPASQLA